RFEQRCLPLHGDVGTLPVRTRLTRFLHKRSPVTGGVTMTCRSALPAFFALFAAIVPAGLKAQEAADAASSNQLTAAVSQLTQQVAQLSTRVQQMQNELSELKGAPPAAADAGAAAERSELRTLEKRVQANTDLIDSVD